MIGQATESLMISSFYFLFVAGVTRTILFFIGPMIRLAKGPSRHPRFFLQSISLFFFQFSEVKFRRASDFLLALVSFALCFVLLALIPISGTFPVYFERPDVVFVLLYLLARLIYSSVSGRVGHSLKTEFDQPLVSAVILTFLFCILGIKKGGGAHVNETVFHGIALSSFGGFFAFLTTLFFSRIFIFPKPSGLTGINFLSLPHAMSKIIWFSLLIWIFFGVIPGQGTTNLLFFFAATSALIVIHDALSFFFPRMSANISYALMKKYLVPAILLMLLLAWIESRLLW